VRLIPGDASTLTLPPQSARLVLQSTVFSSLLDDAFQQRLADAMWSWVAPGGGVLWYDFTVDNPRNPDVSAGKGTGAARHAGAAAGAPPVPGPCGDVPDREFAALAAHAYPRVAREGLTKSPFCRGPMRR
jgi:hypothetical protein